jgi:hypothetical protein
MAILDSKIYSTFFEKNHNYSLNSNGMKIFYRKPIPLGVTGKHKKTTQPRSGLDGLIDTIKSAYALCRWV